MIELHRNFTEFGPHGTSKECMSMNYHKISGTYQVKIEEQCLTFGEAGLDALEQLIKEMKERT